MRRPTILLALMLAGPAIAPAPAAEPIRYAVRFPAPQTHYVEVEADVPTDGRPEIEVMMPVWTPGSYLVREFSRNVEGVTAQTADGKAVPVSKSRKNRWKVATGGADRVTVRYRVYGREMGVQTNWIDAGFALINGAPTFVTRADDVARSHEVAITPASGWGRSISGLDSPTPHHFVAPDYDTLVDSPIYVGNPTVHEFTVDGKPHYLVDEGENGVWDGPRAVRDVETIVRTQHDFWGSLPYERYVFFNMLTEAGGGLEHKNSTVLMASRWATRRRADYLNWLKLVSHEFFHTWNVKRLRPVELGPFDYENEVVTKSLWIAEGLTSYYGDLLVRRAGLMSVEEYLSGRPVGAGGDGEKARGDIESLQDTPGRAVQPLESSSADTWIKFYRRDENTANTGISYYTKGSVVGFLLDGEIRRATNGAKSLDDVMRLAYSRFSGAKGYTPADFRAVAAEVAGTDLAAFFHRCLETTDELDYAAALQWHGLRFAPDPATSDKEKEKDKDKEKAKEPKPEKAWLGLETKAEGGRLNVTVVKRETPGYAAGFNVGDEILAIGDERMGAEVWARRMEQYRPDEKVSVLVARRGRLLRLDATFGREPASRFKLEVDPAATEDAKAHRRAWLGAGS